MTDKNKTCEVTVTVSGVQGSGKTTLMAVLAQSLRGAGHEVVVPDHTPSAVKAISDLSLPYRVTFRELEPGQESLTVVVDSITVASVMDDCAEQINLLGAELEESRRAYAEATTRVAFLDARLGEFRSALLERTKELNEAKERVPDADTAAELIRKALSYARESATIDHERHDLNRRSEDMKADLAKMRRESEARMREAHAMMLHALTGERPPVKTPADIQMERRVAARNLSATEKLALANGAEPINGAEMIVAGALDNNAQSIAEAMFEDAGMGYNDAVEAMAQARAADAAVPLTEREAAWNEASLASEVERRLLGGGEHPLIDKLLEGRA